jgi:subtilisin family serine protease
MPSLTSMASALAITVLAGGLALPADAADPGPAEDVTARRLADRTPGGTPLGGQSAGDADAIAALRAARPGTVRLVVRVRDAAAVSRALRTTLSAGVESAIRLPELNAFSLVVPSQQADTVRRTLAARDDVTEVFAAHRRKFSDVPNDPDWVNQRAYLTTVSAPAAWDVTHGSTSARIAVIDSGIDTSHPDLAGKVVASYNAVTGTTSVNDTIGHGTEVASVAAANTNNSTGIAGAGFASMLLAVKVDDAAGDIWSDAVADGIRWAADNGADVINVSLGSTGDDALERDAVAYARSRGALVVAAAGNEGTSTPMYPAAYDGVIAVGATDQSGSARTSFSSYGTWVDVGAPGLNIRAAKAGGGLATVSGTSFAAPLVAGEAALLAAYPSQPTEPQLAAAIRAGTKGGALGFDRGLVDFRAAFNTLAPTSVPTITEPGSGSTISGTVRVTATSQAAKVRFSVGGTAATATPSVVDGTATATLPTYGLSGTQTVEATDCDQFGVCAATGHQISVTIANNPPVMTAPTQGATIGADIHGLSRRSR